MNSYNKVARIVITTFLLSMLLMVPGASAKIEFGQPFRAIENYCAWPNLTLLPDGAIIATVFNKPSHGGVPGDVECWSSTDGGWTWQYRGTPAYGGENSNRMNVAAGLAKNGDLLALVSGYEDPGKFKKFLPTLVCRSADGGFTWKIENRSFPRNPAGKVVVPFGDIIIADDGGLVASVYSGNSYAVKSDDDGHSWRILSVISSTTNETAPLHLGSGKWLAAVRTYGDQHIDLYKSDDNGQNWQFTQQLTNAKQHPGHLLKLADGRILFTTGDRRTGSLGVAAMISSDNGKTWSKQFRVADSPGTKRKDVGYPSSVQRKDGKIVTAFYTNEGGYHMGVVIWELPDADSTVLNIGSRLELFVDHYLIDKLDGVKLRLCKPIDEGPVLMFDKPWEGPFCGYATVIHDGDTYRLFYRGLPVAKANGTKSEVTCYAESKNGIKWKKPELGLFKAESTRKNNIILANAAPVTHNFSPFLDDNPNTSPDAKYKALGGSKLELIAYISPDGIHWKKLQDEPVFRDKGWVFDSQNVAFWSQAEQQYVLYYRKSVKGIRAIARTTSRDFIHWSEPKSMIYSDTNTTVPSHHLYTNQTHPYFRADHIYISTAARFMPGRQVLTEAEANAINVNPGYFKDTADVVLMTTRGTDTYDRTFMSALIKPGIGPQNWVSRTNYPVLGVVQTSPTEMSLYLNQNYAQTTAHIRRYSLRIDGFASVSAPYEGGELLTNVLKFDGDQLVINFATSAAGFVKVEIQNADGQPLPGYSLGQSRELIGNEIQRIVSWNDNSDTSKLAGKPIRLRFVMKDADLYSIRFQ